MASAVEANSLSSITAIASNPPQHPHLPVERAAAPLTLYIARVPGSRDVFLTPLKPKDKVVSAEDVQSSLYYVHVNCEVDHQVLEPAQRPSPAKSNASQFVPTTETGAKRKPVLPARPLPPYPMDDQMPDESHKPLSPRKSQQIARKPVISSNKNGQGTSLPYPDLPEIPPRPLPTPPDEHPRRSSLHTENVRLLRHSEHSDDTNPYFRQYASIASGDHQTADETLKVELGTLTLIRRNPATSEQWNVASVHDPPVHEVSSSALLNPTSAKRTKKGGAPLYLDITNPGYIQFIDKDRPESRLSTSTHSSDSEPPPEGTFRRRLYMPGSRYSEHGYSHRKLESVDSTNSSEIRRTMRDRALSDLSGNTAVDRRSKIYSFASPWDGRCEFNTGATGKSLKCRHTFAQQGTADVSELRFNLPTSTRNAPSTVGEKRSSYFSRHSRLLSTDSGDGSSMPSIMIDEDGRVDLSLGQEKAGGGFGGKQAKLGKLIIEPEGFKMLDLLVAANVGLWWRAYERA